MIPLSLRAFKGEGEIRIEAHVRAEHARGPLIQYWGEGDGRSHTICLKWFGMGFILRACRLVGPGEGYDLEDLIDILESFNRKERYFLLTRTLALRSEGEQATFRLDGEFRKKLGCAIGLHEQGIEICEDAFVAMDYHLDWIHGSLALAYRDKDKIRLRDGKELFPYEVDEVTGTQEDIDLLVAFKVENKYHLALIEAKGYSSWNTEQLYSKSKRLGEIFCHSGKRYDNVEPHFVLMSKKQPQLDKLCTEDWPSWMKGKKLHHIQLDIPSGTDRHRVERCNQRGQKSKNGKFFHCPSA